MIVTVRKVTWRRGKWEIKRTKGGEEEAGREEGERVEGINHCHSYCSSAKFRDLMCRGKIYRSDWLEESHSLELYTGHIPKSEFSDQSQRCVSLRSSNYGISPNDSANDSGSG